MAKDKIGMIYKGNGFFVSVPARDLTESEVAKFGKDFLLSLGLYEEPYQPPPKPKKVEEFEDEPQFDIEEMED